VQCQNWPLEEACTECISTLRARICWHTRQVFELVTTGLTKLFSKSCASFWSNHYLEIKNIL